jgi:hypothetical protein
MCVAGGGICYGKQASYFADSKSFFEDYIYFRCKLQNSIVTVFFFFLGGQKHAPDDDIPESLNI